MRRKEASATAKSDTQASRYHNSLANPCPKPLTAQHRAIPPRAGVVARMQRPAVSSCGSKDGGNCGHGIAAIRALLPASDAHVHRHPCATFN